jgi:hypothetical protein
MTPTYAAVEHLAPIGEHPMHMRLKYGAGGTDAVWGDPDAAIMNGPQLLTAQALVESTIPSLAMDALK